MSPAAGPMGRRRRSGGFGASVGGRNFRVGVGPAGLFVSARLPGTAARVYYFEGENAGDQLPRGPAVFDPLEVLRRAETLLAASPPKAVAAYSLVKDVFDVSAVAPLGVPARGWGCLLLAVSFVVPVLLFVSVPMYVAGSSERRRRNLEMGEELSKHLRKTRRELESLLANDIREGELVGELVAEGGLGALPAGKAKGLSITEPVYLDVSAERVEHGMTPSVEVAPVRVERGRLLATAAALYFVGDAGHSHTMPNRDVIAADVEGNAMLVVTTRNQVAPRRHFLPGHAFTARAYVLACIAQARQRDSGSSGS